MASALEDQFRDSIINRQRETLLTHIRENPAITISELTDFRGELSEVLKRITVGEIIKNVRSKKSTGAKSAGPVAAEKNLSQVRNVKTRTKEGRDGYDEAVLDTLNNYGRAMTAVELRKVVGGNPDQARRSLNRLIELGQVSYEGKARGMKYSAC